MTTFNIFRFAKKLLPIGSDVILNGTQLIIFPTAYVDPELVGVKILKTVGDRQLQDSIKSVKIFHK